MGEAELILHQDTRLGFHQYEYIIKLKKFTDEENSSLEDRILYIQRIVTEIGDRCRELLTHPDDKIQLVFSSDPGLISAPFATRFCNRKEFTNRYLLDRANTLLNSNQNFVLSDSFHIGVKIYKESEIVGGSVPRLSAFNNYDHCLLRKKSIVFLRGGTKNLCFSKSVQILLAQRRFKKKSITIKQWRRYLCKRKNKGRNYFLEHRAIMLQKSAKIAIGRKLKICDIKKIEEKK